MRRLVALIRKETLQMIRDPSTLLIAFVLPLVLLFLFGFGVNLDANRIRLGVVSEDQGLSAQDFFKVLSGSSFIQPTYASSLTELMPELKKGTLHAILIIPRDFSQHISQQQARDVQLMTDGSNPNTARFTLHYLQGLWATWQQTQAMTHKPSIEVIPRYWFNPTTVSRHTLLPGSIAIIMTIIGAMLTALVVAREWERGTIETLLSTPMTRLEFLLAKIIPYFCLGLIAMALNVWLTTTVMDVPFKGSYFSLIFMTSLFLCSALGLGLLISTLTKNQFNAAQIALFAAFLPAVILSGFIYEISSMPVMLQKVTAIIPARHFVNSLQTLFQADTIPSILLKNSIYLLGLAFFWLGLTLLSTKKRLN